MDLLPGLWVGLLGAALAAALRRWLDPVPWRVLLAHLAAVGVLFGPVLFGGGLLLPLDNLRGEVPFAHLAPAEPHGNLLQGDLVQLVAPSLAAVRAAWAEGRWPLWNAQAGAGMPLLADPQAQALQPLVLLGCPLPLVRAAGVTAALRVLAALVFSFLWMRRQGLGEAAALAGSFAYGLGGFVLLWVGWPIANPAALLPLVLYGVARCDEPGGRRDALLLALGTLALLLGGHPETILYALALAAAFLAGRVLGRPRGLRRALLVRAGSAAAVAALAAAPAWLPAAAYLPHTLRAARLAEGPARPAPPRRAADALLPVAAPNAFGNSRFLYYWGPANTNEDAGGFVGTAALLAALLAVRARRRFPGERPALGIAALCLLLLLPLPGLSTRRLLLPLALCLAYLGACTLERYRLGEVRRREVLLAAAGLGLVLAWAYLGHADPADPHRLEVFRLGWLGWQLRFLALAVLLLLAAARLPRGRGFAVAGVAAAVAAELLLLHLPDNPPMPRRLAFPATGPIRFLQSKLGTSPRRGPRYRMAALGRVLPPNLASLYGLTDARIYNPSAPRAYVAATAPITAGWWGERPLFGEPASPLYGRLGVRYLLAAPDAALPAPWERVYADPDGAVWQRPRALPRLSLAGRPAAGRVAIPRCEDAWITARLRVEPGQRLASSVYQDGGWRLLLDGEPRRTRVDDGAFLAAGLPAGSRRADLLYRPRPFLLGCLLAACGLAAGGAFVAAPAGRRYT